MDIFRLLARSTTLLKSGFGQSRAAQNVPSAGGPLDPSSLEQGAVQVDHAAEEQPRGTKRKRREIEETDANVPEELDFFSGQSRQAKITANGGDQNGSSTKRRSDMKDHRPDGAVTILGAQERSRILKAHKIKVTVLGAAEDAQKELKWKNTNKSRNLEGKKEPHRQIWPQPLLSFTDLRRRYRISNRLAENLETQGYSEFTEVQLAALPILLGSDDDRGLVDTGAQSSKRMNDASADLLTVAPTGSGKTLAYLIPILQNLVKARRTASSEHEGLTREHHLQAVILAPTHELVDQIVNEARKLAVGTGIKVGGMKKGMKVHANERTNGDITVNDEPLIKADVLVSTPLMMLNAILSGSNSTPNPLPSVRYLVLDEADILLDPLFREQTLSVWSACPNELLQTTLWSATIGSSIESLAQTFILSRRRNLNLNKSSAGNHHILRLIVGLKDSAIPILTHHLTYTASEQGKLLALRQLLRPSSTTTGTRPLASCPTRLHPPFLIFTQTISRAIALHAELRYDIPFEAGGSSRLAVLHADLSSPARSAIMAGLRKGEIWIVITTDLLSRGVDIRGLNGVVNYDIPTTGASYVHRVGRTGRQGRGGGVAVTFYTKEDIPYVKNIANVIAASERARGKEKQKNKANDGESAPTANHDGNTNGKRDELEDNASEAGGGGEGGLQKWLLDALPRVSKKTKKELKKRGVESRRPTMRKDERSGTMKRKARISTKSGFERRMEDRRKGAMMGSRRRKKMAAGKSEGAGAGALVRRVDEESEEWGGFDE